MAGGSLRPAWPCWSCHRCWHVGACSCRTVADWHSPVRCCCRCCPSCRSRSSIPGSTAPGSTAAWISPRASVSRGRSGQSRSWCCSAWSRSRVVRGPYNAKMTQRPTRILVDLDAITHNLGEIRKHVGVPVMGIVKAEAYGHGLVPVARHLQAQGVDQLGVAFLEEGVALREAGITLPILVLGGIFGPQAAGLIANDLEVTVSSLDKLHQVEAAAQSLGRKATVHLKVDTGMERIGVHSYSCGPFIEAAVASRWCTIKGIYSHLACADDPASPATALQVERFAEACSHFERLGVPMPLRHLANSGGVLHFPATWLDMV